MDMLYGNNTTKNGIVITVITDYSATPNTKKDE